MSSKKTPYAVQDDEGKRELRPLTWQLISQTVAQLLLIGAVGLWLQLLILVIGPQFKLTPGGMISFAPIFWSSLIPSTPANNVLSWLSAKYGGAGYWFAFGCALVFTSAEMWLLDLYWRTRPAFLDGGVFAGSEITLLAFTAISLILFVGLTAWALNRLTPSQLIAAMAESVNAAEILRAEKLKDLQFQITYAYGVSLLKSDLLALGVEKFRQVSGEFAAIVADMEQHEAKAFRNMAELMEATELGENMFRLVYGQNDEAATRHKQLMQVMRDAAEYHRELAMYSEEAAQLGPQHMSSALPAPSPGNVIDMARVMPDRRVAVVDVAPNVPIAAQSQGAPAEANVAATLERSANVRQRPPEADQGGQDVTLNVLAATFGRGMFNAALIVEHTGVSQRSAERWIREWRESGDIVDGKMRGMYVLAITKEAHGG